MQLGIGVEHFTHVSPVGENFKIKINYFNITISFACTYAVFSINAYIPNWTLQTDRIIAFRAINWISGVACHTNWICDILKISRRTGTFSTCINYIITLKLHYIIRISLNQDNTLSSILCIQLDLHILHTPRYLNINSILSYNYNKFLSINKSNIQLKNRHINSIFF